MASPFLILFTARSGSTALYGNLKNLPKVRMHAEVFGNKRLPGDVEQNDDNRIKFLRKFWAPFKDGATPDIDFRGFKFMVTQVDTQFERPARLIKVALQYKPKIIVLRRQNMLKQMISSLNSRRLNELSLKLSGNSVGHHIQPENRGLLDELKKTPLHVDVRKLEWQLAGLKAAYERLDHVAKGFGEVHNITYEDYLLNRDEVVRGVLSHIGIDPASYQPSDAYLKITSDSLEEVVENYSELKQSLEGTPYAAMA